MPSGAFSYKSLIPAVNVATTHWTTSDYAGMIKVRLGIGRDRYSITPGLHKIGNPGKESVVLVSANYKLSFDVLRKNLGSMDAWILVIDTKGVNVWCAAGKGTFSTDGIVKGVKSTSLDLRVNHRKLIVPQLGAPGVAAHEVLDQTGFKVLYGPVQAKDIPDYIKAGFKAKPDMREVKFNLTDRLKLIPVDILYSKYKLLILLALVFVLSGVDKTGFLFSKMLSTGWVPVIALFVGYLAGVVFTPLLLPYVPFRAFSAKGALLGLVVTFLMLYLQEIDWLEKISLLILSASISSFMAMNFTGSSTFTSLSGVKKEMAWALPFQIVGVLTGFVGFVISKLV